MFANNALRLDAIQMSWFNRQLEYISTKIYSTLYPINKSRTLIPTETEAPDWAKQFTYTMFEQFGRARYVSSMADDIPMADAAGTQTSMPVRMCAMAWGWDILEIKASQATGQALDSARAISGRAAVDNLVDETLSVGFSAAGLKGLLNQTDFVPVVLNNKAGGGKTWAKAAPKEIIKDVSDGTTAILDKLNGAGGVPFERFQVVIPISQYGLAANMMVGDGSSQTVLKFIRDNNPNVENIDQWHRCKGAGATGSDRMAIYPKDPLVVAALVPMEFSVTEPKERGLRMEQIGMATCGGVFVRYKQALLYGDGL